MGKAFECQIVFFSSFTAQLSGINSGSGYGRNSHSVPDHQNNVSGASVSGSNAASGLRFPAPGTAGIRQEENTYQQAGPRSQSHRFTFRFSEKFRLLGFAMAFSVKCKCRSERSGQRPACRANSLSRSVWRRGIPSFPCYLPEPLFQGDFHEGSAIKPRMMSPIPTSGLGHYLLPSVRF